MIQVNLKNILVIVLIFLDFSLALSQSTQKDSLQTISTTGIFSGKKVVAGNFETEEVYKINDYCISLKDITSKQVDSLKGKRVCVTGQLKIVQGKTWPAKTSNDGKIYEPYVEPAKKFIIKPKITIIWDSREPVTK